MKEFTVVKVFTHNIVFAQHEGREYIVIGKGIGFNVKTGNVIKEKDVSSFYQIKDIDKLSKYERMILDTDDNIVWITEQAIHHAEKRLDYTFEDSLHMSLLDHINFAIYRYNNRLKVDYFMSDAYYLMYSELFDIALEMVEIINKSLDVDLPQSEVGSIILHLHAGLRKDEVSTSAFYSMVVTRSLDYLIERLGSNILDNSIARARLITHLKFALKRTGDGVGLHNPLLDIFKEKYHDYYLLASDLSNVLKNEFNVNLPEAEIAYIAMHIYNLKFS